MNYLPSPESHSLKTRIKKDLALSLLERKMYRCMLKIAQSPKPRTAIFAYINNKSFGVNDNGGVTRAEALSHGLAQKYLSIENRYIVGKRPKGYRLTDKGKTALSWAVSFGYKAETVTQKAPKIPDTLVIQRIHRRNLQELNLSSKFKKSKLTSFYSIDSFYRTYRTCKSGECQIKVDDYGRVHYPITNLQKSLRPNLSLSGPDGDSLVEVDIKCSNPVMLLKGGIVHPDEAQDWAELIHSNVFYEHLSAKNTKRSLAKKYINAVFNGSAGKTRSRLSKFFPKTMARINRDTGKELMRLESSIMNPLVEELDSDGIQCLRLHDAILCKPEEAHVIAYKLGEKGFSTQNQSVSISDLLKAL